MKKIIIILALFLSSCSTYHGNFAAISDKPISLYTLTSNNILIERKAEAQVSRHVAVVIPFSKAPTIARAIDQVLNKYNGDYLANVTIERKSFQLMWLYHYTAWKISGDVMKTL